jgi:hypothetical protein
MRIACGQITTYPTCRFTRPQMPLVSALQLKQLGRGHQHVVYVHGAFRGEAEVFQIWIQYNYWAGLTASVTAHKHQAHVWKLILLTLYFQFMTSRCQVERCRASSRVYQLGGTPTTGAPIEIYIHIYHCWDFVLLGAALVDACRHACLVSWG